jgi:hypothetical protein
MQTSAIPATLPTTPPTTAEVDAFGPEPESLPFPEDAELGVADADVGPAPPTRSPAEFVDVADPDCEYVEVNG